MLTLIILPFWTSFLIRVYAWIALLKPEGLINEALMALGLIDTPLIMINTGFGIVIGMTYTYLPFAILPIYASLVGQSPRLAERSEEHTSELQSLMRISYAVFCLKKKNKQ